METSRGQICWIFLGWETFFENSTCFDGFFISYLSSFGTMKWINHWSLLDDPRSLIQIDIDIYIECLFFLYTHFLAICKMDCDCQPVVLSGRYFHFHIPKKSTKFWKSRSARVEFCPGSFQRSTQKLLHPPGKVSHRLPKGKFGKSIDANIWDMLVIGG